MNSLEISYIGSACGKNKYESRSKTMLLLLCRQYKDIYKNAMYKCGAFTTLDPECKTYDSQLKKIYSEYKKTVQSPNDFKQLEKDITERLSSENKEIKEEDLKHASRFLENSFKKDCGTNNERNVISKMQYKKGNNKMYYYYSDNGWYIKGLHDATDNDIVIEIKTRMRPQNVRKNEYDLYQLFGYLLAMNKTKGKIVQKCNNIIYDSEIETDNEYGVIDISLDEWKEKFNTFKKELNDFFLEINNYKDKLLNIIDVINFKNYPIASFDENGMPHNVNPKYEKIVMTLS